MLQLITIKNNKKTLPRRLLTKLKTVKKGGCSPVDFMLCKSPGGPVNSLQIRLPRTIVPYVICWF